jgi:hypothetical protein
MPKLQDRNARRSHDTSLRVHRNYLVHRLQRKELMGNEARSWSAKPLLSLFLSHSKLALGDLSTQPEKDGLERDLFHTDGSWTQEG